MHLAFRHDVFCRIVNGRAIILDLQSGRYFSPKAEVSAMLAAAESREAASIPAATELQSLVERGWLVECSGAALSNDFARWPSPVRRHEPESDLSPTARATIIALVRQAVAAVELRRLRFGDLVERLRVRRARLEILRGPRSIDAVVRAFEAADRMASAHDRCLPRSIALFRSLLAAGHPAALALGVRTYPFGAHAWVQLHDMVIGDDLDRVQTYSPILVL